jgi:hypothetical protein
LALLWPLDSDPLSQRRLRTRLWKWAALLAVIALLTLVATRALYATYSGLPFPAPRARGVIAAGTIILSAPGRALQVFVSDLSTTTAAVLGWTIFGLSLWFAPPRLRRAVGTLGAGAAALCLALGLVRFEYRLADFAGADRYYYPLLAPWCLAVAGPIVRVRNQTVAWLLVIVCAGPLVIGRERMVERFPASALPVFESYWLAADRLATAIAAEAASGVTSDPTAARPWRLSNGTVPLIELEAGGMRLSDILRTIWPRLPDGVTFGGASTEDQARQNAVLDRWAQGQGWDATPVCAQNGALTRALGPGQSRIDFGQGPESWAVVSGWEAWSGSNRFMTEATAVLRIVSAPGDLLLSVWIPDLGSAHPPIALSAELGGRSLGTVAIAHGGVRQVRFALPVTAGTRARGEAADIVLRAGPSWRPIDHMAGNPDARHLTLAVNSVRFADDDGAAAQRAAVRCVGSRR